MSPNVSEQKNLLHFLLLHPFYLARFVVRSPSLLLMHLIRREIRDSRSMDRKNDLRSAAERKKGLSFERFPVVDRIEITNIDAFEEIELASRTVSSRRQLDWSYINEDIEDTFSLNRFCWLLTAIHTRPSAKLARRALEWITNWIDTMGESFHHPSWESYSVSERLANWPFILRVIERFQHLDGGTEKKIAEAMGTHLDHLLRNLELRGEFTNNHILNNARGLYIGGLLVAHESAVEKAKELFIEWTPKLFHSDGMLKAGSSHYQFLLCQRFEQVCLLSHLTGDDTFAAFMKKWTQAIQSARDLFNIQSGEGRWAMPLIGDISPDYKPTWFSPLSMGGWDVIRNSYAQGDSFASTSQTMIDGLRKMCEGFFRYDRDDATVFWHVPDGPVPAGSHGHFDVGSFIFFLKGKEIFTDSGRRSYRAEGSTGVYAKAHNVLLINGLGPFCEDRHLNLIDAYPYQVSRIMVATDEDDRLVLSLDVDGFRRLASPVLWRRSYSFNDRTMTIRDDIEAKGGHRLETRFIIAEGLSAEKTDEGIYIKSESGLVTMKVLNPHGDSAQSFSMEKVEISRMYGRSEEALAFVVKNTIRGNHKNIYEMQWQA
jgi:hypothetical protein